MSSNDSFEGNNSDVGASAEPRSVSPGETLGFDEIMSLDAIPEMERNEEVEGQGGEEKKAAEKSDKKEPKKEPKEEKEESDKNSRKKQDEKEQEEKAELDKQAEIEVKKLKAKYNDSDLDIPEEAIFEIPVNGKLEPVTLKDLRNNYSGRVAWDRKFTELDKERSEFRAEKKTVNEQVGRFVDLVVEKKQPVQAMAEMAEIVGLDPYKFLKNFRESLLPQMQKYAQMTPEERTAFEKSEENDFLRNRLERDNKVKESEQAQRELEDYFVKSMEQHSISSEELEAAHKALQDRGVSEDSDNYHELIINEALTGKQVDLVMEAVRSVNPELINDDALLVEMVRTLRSDPELTKDDIAEIVRSVYGSSTHPADEAKDDGKANKKLKKAAAATGTTIDNAGNSKQAEDPNNKYISFDDL